jgi:hypothetical protein
MTTRHRTFAVVSVASWALIVSCASTSTHDGSEAQTTIPLIDPSLPHAVLQQPGWGYGRVDRRDLDGDGTEEHIVVIADVALHGDKLLWEDAHAWQVYIEEPDGARTYVYSRRVPMGHVQVRLTPAPDEGLPMLVLLEQTPHKLEVYEVRYDAPGQVFVSELVRRELQPGNSTGTPEP